MNQILAKRLRCIPIDIILDGKLIHRVFREDDDLQLRIVPEESDRGFHNTLLIGKAVIQLSYQKKRSQDKGELPDDFFFLIRPDSCFPFIRLERNKTIHFPIFEEAIDEIPDGGRFLRHGDFLVEDMSLPILEEIDELRDILFREDQQIIESRILIRTARGIRIDELSVHTGGFCNINLHQIQFFCNDVQEILDIQGREIFFCHDFLGKRIQCILYCFVHFVVLFQPYIIL